MLLMCAVQTYCFSATQGSAVSIALVGQILGEKVASCCFSCAVLVRVELSSHLEGLRCAAEFIVALGCVLKDERHQRNEGTDKRCYINSKYPETTFVLLTLAYLFSENAALYIQLRRLCRSPAFVVQPMR